MKRENLRTMKKNVFGAFLSSLVLLSTSCSKDDDGPITGEDRERAILGQWSYREVHSQGDFNGDGRPTAGNLLNSQEVPECFKDDLYFFRENGTFALAGDEIKCYEEEPATIAGGGYSFTNNFGTIQMEDNEDWDIISLDGDSLTVEWEEVDDNGDLVQVQATFNRD